MVEQLSRGIDLAKDFYQLALEEFNSGEILKQKDGCEKGYRAAMEALDALLSYKGYVIEVGDPKAHYQREDALSKLEDSDDRIFKVTFLYSTFKNRLHGICFYTIADPKNYKTDLIRVEEFISLIEVLINE